MKLKRFSPVAAVPAAMVLANCSSLPRPSLPELNAPSLPDIELGDLSHLQPDISIPNPFAERARPFYEACLAISYASTPLCACAEEKAKDDLNGAERAYLTAIWTDDVETLGTLRQTLTTEEYIRASNFMPDAAQACAGEIQYEPGTTPPEGATPIEPGPRAAHAANPDQPA